MLELCYFFEHADASVLIFALDLFSFLDGEVLLFPEFYSEVSFAQSVLQLVGRPYKEEELVTELPKLLKLQKLLILL